MTHTLTHETIAAYLSDALAGLDEVTFADVVDDVATALNAA